MKMFLRDDALDIQIPYNGLMQSFTINSSNNFFLKLVYMLAHDLDIELTENYFKKITLNKSSKFFDKNQLIQKIKNTQSFITVQTSGTTSKPKKIKHKVQNLFKSVIIKKNLVDAVWGYTYNPYHIGGLQVFFQAFLNGSTIIYLYGKSIDHVVEQIYKYRITHLSGTSTFYKLLISKNEKFESVQRVTFGGEISTKYLYQKMSNIFPQAKITNVYATSESGTLFASHDHIFTIENENQVKIDENELYIHKKFIGENQDIKGDWYATGDIVKIVGQNPLRFVFQYRDSDIINVGGQKVNPHEIEQYIESHPNISSALVYKKENSVLGNIILCDVVKSNESLTEKDILTFLRNKKVANYKLPRMINFINQLQFSKNYKSVRSNR